MRLMNNGNCRVVLGFLPFLLTCTSSIPEKVCKSDITLDSSNIHSFKNCTKIDGFLYISNSTFTGNWNIARMEPSELEIFSTIKEITGTFSITAIHLNFTDLHYFRNLETIRSTGNEYSLYIHDTSLKSFGFRSIKTIEPSIHVGENNNLCFAEGIKWRKLMNTYNYLSVYFNRPKDACVADNMVCHEECSEDGCWGPGVDECLSCKNFSLEGTCVGNYSYPGIYQSGNHTFGRCHEECDGTCSGPGPWNCMKCKHVKNGPYCVASCPSMKFERAGECEPCNENCVGGCTGPGLFIGPGGCDTCHKAIASSDYPNEFNRCLKANEPCKEGYYSELVSMTESEEDLKSMAGKLICRQCHPRCKNCTGYGFHLSVCNECAHFRSEEQCEDQCPIEYYTDYTTMRCIRCSMDCKGCRGPGSDQCESCRHFKVPIGDNITHKFICSDKCPDDKPDIRHDQGEPYCWAKDPVENISTSAIIGGMLGCAIFIGLFVGLFGYKWLQRAKSRENTARMTMSNLPPESAQADPTNP